MRITVGCDGCSGNIHGGRVVMVVVVIIIVVNVTMVVMVTMTVAIIAMVIDTMVHEDTYSCIGGDDGSHRYIMVMMVMVMVLTM